MEGIIFSCKGSKVVTGWFESKKTLVHVVCYVYLSAQVGLYIYQSSLATDGSPNYSGRHRLVKILEEQCIGYMFSQDPTLPYTSKIACAYYPVQNSPSSSLALACPAVWFCSPRHKVTGACVVIEVLVLVHKIFVYLFPLKFIWSYIFSIIKLWFH
jgi:ACR3 family arsenite efflux pump ArsB